MQHSAHLGGINGVIDQINWQIACQRRQDLIQWHCTWFLTTSLTDNKHGDNFVDYPVVCEMTGLVKPEDRRQTRLLAFAKKCIN